MRIIKKTLLLTALFALLFPVVAQGAVFIVDDEGNVAPATVTDDDLYIAGVQVTVDKDVSDDLFAGGEQIVVSGHIGGDVMAVGESVRVEGVVDDDIMLAGERVRISAPTVEDVFAAGQTVELSSDTVVNGSVFVAGQKVNIAGTIKGNVRAAGEVKVKSGTTIEGDLITYGAQEPAIEDNVVINGTRRHHTAEKRPVRSFVLSAWVRGVVSWFVVGIILLYLLSGLTRVVVAKAVRRSGASLGIGILWALLFMPAVILLFISIIGWPVALLVVLLTLSLFILAYAYAMIVTGTWILSKIVKPAADTTGQEPGEPNITWQHVLLGAVIVKAVGLLPLIGGPLVFIVTLLALGALLMSLWKMVRSKAVKDKEAVA